MAVRVTDAEVKEIIDWDSTISLTPFIEIANSLVTELCTDSGHDAQRLKNIERWLAAHFYHIDDQHISREKAASVGVEYQFKIDLAINQTKYGQQAIVLDTAGNLAQLNKRIVDGEAATVVIGWLGQDYTTADTTD